MLRKFSDFYDADSYTVALSFRVRDGPVDIRVITRLRNGRSGIWFGVQIPVESRQFSLPRNVHNRAEAHPASHSTGTGVLYRGEEAGL